MFSLIEVKRYKRKYLGAPDPRIGFQLVSRMFLPWNKASLQMYKSWPRFDDDDIGDVYDVDDVDDKEKMTKTMMTKKGQCEEEEEE